MAEVITMPRLSDTMEEGTVAKWLFKVGEKINEGDILAEIETDKATMEFESFNEGTLLYIGVQEGETAPVDVLLAIIGDAGEDISEFINGNSNAEVISENKKEEIRKELSLLYKKEIKLNFSIDESLISGSILKVGSKMIDNSAKNKFNRILNNI